MERYTKEQRILIVKTTVGKLRSFQGIHNNGPNEATVQRIILTFSERGSSLKKNIAAVRNNVSF